MKSVALLALLLVSCALVPGAQAASDTAYPARPITIVVPFPPGGGPDKLARVIGEKLAVSLGQSIIVENRPGASGTLGAAHVARAVPDGHTLMMAPNTFVLSPLVLPKGVVKYDVQADFAPVIVPSKALLVLAAHPGLGVKTLDELVRYAQRNPGVTYTGSSSGSPMHVAGEMFKQAAGIDMMFVAYKGLAPAVADTLAGHVKLIFGPYGTLAPHLKSGALVPLGGLDAERFAFAPDIAPIREQGYPAVVANIWSGLFAPRQTPAPVIERLNREINKILQMPDVKAALEGSGEILVGGPPEVLAEMVKRDTEVYGKIVRTANITAD
ncbi:MAG: tripartite tricarboxylate transporter substrate-binding protein [Pigmentiphaga sp.]|uniref:Bug family tripartite tricarboxylate transporter substrate binding protein n=1 Tax=Pigmentiphaga sp. TaxID=1977564 RepID=UPI0029B8A3B4|nr:tripartite tricarboxylate transporter substrate-binding protein [Pigmentiphaga sp.]MDX3906264.1 tripartite tricarboxylate transporter substrate-binding protein [Pigmentiphaga sp.]